MIRYENVHKVFGTVDVLKGISFEIPTGQVVCILGPCRFWQNHTASLHQLSGNAHQGYHYRGG